MGASDDLGGLDRVAANERHFLVATRRAGNAPVVLDCECTHALCDQQIQLTRDEYEPVRSSAARYAIHPHDAHVDPAVDEVVDRHISYWVVERRSSVEVLEFYGGGQQMVALEMPSSSGDMLGSTPAPDDDPGTGT
jgi:hypothetical protein